MSYGIIKKDVKAKNEENYSEQKTIYGLEIQPVKITNLKPSLERIYPISQADSLIGTLFSP